MALRSFQALLDRAVQHHGQGKLAEAEQLYAQILQGDSAHKDTWHMLGVLRAQQGRREEAAELIGAVVEKDPQNALALANYGNVLNGLGRFTEALANFDRSIAFNPAYAEAWNGRGNALQALSRLDEALFSYDRLLALDPNNAAGHLNRGNVLQLSLRYGDAVAAYDKVIALAPRFAEGWNNRGVALQNAGRLEEALESFRQAEMLDPVLAQAPLNRSFCHFLMRDFAQGLPLYEWRKQTPVPMEARVYPQPLWTGAEDICSKMLFAYIEQGLGDTIQFYRYAALAQARGAKVILSVPDKLIALLRGASPAVELIGWGQVPPRFDFHIPLASIPLAVGMGADTIPATDHYLTAQPERVAQWKEKLGDHGFRIGIAWQGNELVMGAEGKSFPVGALESIAKTPGVRLIRLQKNAGSEQLDHLLPGMTVESYDFDDGPDAFLDTAAMMKACDLVISADTAPAHLAGALGVPTWVALKYIPDWRWFLERGDCPWYPSLRLFRQPQTGDWASVFRAMAAELASRKF